MIAKTVTTPAEHATLNFRLHSIYAVAQCVVRYWYMCTQVCNTKWHTDYLAVLPHKVQSTKFNCNQIGKSVPSNPLLNIPNKCYAIKSASAQKCIYARARYFAAESQSEWPTLLLQASQSKSDLFHHKTPSYPGLQ